MISKSSNVTILSVSACMCVCIYFLFPDCRCHLPGSTDANCNQTTGQCSCKENVGGRQCDACLPGYYNLSSSNSAGCQPCNCHFGSSENAGVCDAESGLCMCRSGFTGRDCSQLLPGFHVPDLNIVVEAEDQVWGTNVTTLSHLDSDIRPYTGRGFASIVQVANGVGVFDFVIPPSLVPYISHSYCVSVRSAPLTPVLPSVCESMSEFVGNHEFPGCTDDPCTADLRYTLTILFDANVTEQLYIDSIVFRPRLDVLFSNFSGMLSVNSSICQDTCNDTSLCSTEDTTGCEATYIQGSSELYNGARGKIWKCQWSVCALKANSFHAIF